LAATTILNGDEAPPRSVRCRFSWSVAGGVAEAGRLCRPALNRMATVPQLPCLLELPA
jgi:hypothetical protein